MKIYQLKFIKTSTDYTINIIDKIAKGKQQKNKNKTKKWIINDKTNQAEKVVKSLSFFLFSVLPHIFLFFSSITSIFSSIFSIFLATFSIVSSSSIRFSNPRTLVF